jgi:hypothetical protein
MAASPGRGNHLARAGRLVELQFTLDTFVLYIAGGSVAEPEMGIGKDTFF